MHETRFDPHLRLLKTAAITRPAISSRPSPPLIATHTQIPRTPKPSPSEPELSGASLGGPDGGAWQEHALSVISVEGVVVVGGSDT